MLSPLQLHKMENEHRPEKNYVVGLYRKRAARQNVTTKLFYLVGFRLQAYRKKAMSALGLHTGDTVIEIGCGTGASSMVGTFAANSSSGAEHVYELYGEALVPVLKNAPFAKSLDLDLAYRYSDYSNAGVTNTYKVSGDWTVVDGLRFRAGYNRAVRAPNVVELFSPQNVVLDGTQDPCAEDHSAATIARIASTGWPRISSAAAATVMTPALCFSLSKPSQRTNSA